LRMDGSMDGLMEWSTCRLCIEQKFPFCEPCQLIFFPFLFLLLSVKVFVVVILLLLRRCTTLS
jgi:hypothetical protein